MNILVLTSVYRDTDYWEDDSSTIVVNSFVYEWEKMGHNVLVVHNAHRYPALFYAIPKGIKAKLSAKLGFPLSEWKSIKKKSFQDHGAQVYRLPMLKIIPHKQHSKIVIRKQLKRITDIIKHQKFIPDVIIGHWASPQMELIAKLKDIYKCRTAVVLHGVGYINDLNFHVDEYLKKIDRIGTRSITQASNVQKMLSLKTRPFICYSGVPDNFLINYVYDKKKFEMVPTTWRFIYVGRLVKYKAIDKTLLALSKLKYQNYTFDIFGEGGELDNLISITKELKLENRVVFHGRIPRNEVIKKMRESHAFIMISKGEAFGLAYLEAMAATCIPIGSVGEGIDGVIINEENGLLCEAQNVYDLVKRLEWLMELNTEKLYNLSKKGYETAQAFSDSNVAKRYLDDVVK